MIELRPPFFCLALAILTVSSARAADPAGKVVFANSEVRVVDAHAAARGLIRGDQVFSGDTIIIEKGKAQIKFTEGGYASMRPQSEFSLSEYVYRDTADGSERGFFRLLKGGVRCVTGAIGEANRRNFRLSTETVMIGIRDSSSFAEQCDLGSCIDKPDRTYLTTYGGILTIVSGSFTGEVHPQQTYYSDGVGCNKTEAHSQRPNLTPAVSALDRQ
jgi:hypothetical protein